MPNNELGVKAITHIPGWAEMLEVSDKVKTEPAAFNRVPLIHRAVKFRADALSGAPMHIYKGDTEIDWPFENDLNTLIWKTEAALLLSGAAYWLQLGNGLITQDLEWLNPFSIEINYKYVEGQEQWAFYQPANGGGPWGSDDMVYFREWDPLQDTHPGVSAAQVALGDSQLLHYITRFAYHFFDGGAMPITVLGVTGSTQTEIERTESKFKNALTNIKNAFKVFAMRAEEIDIQTLTPAMDTLALPELYEQARLNVATAFGIPSTMLEDPAANRATADTHRLTFWADTMRPRGVMIQDVINKQLLSHGGMRFEFGFDEMDVFQEDEAQRAGSLKAYVEAGYPLDLASEILGVDLTEDQASRLQDHLAAKKEMGAALAANLQGKGRPDGAQGDESGAKSNGSHNMHTHLGKWQKKSQNRLKMRKSPAVEFESPYIPDALQGAILGALDAARTAEDIDRVFDSIWGAYP